MYNAHSSKRAVKIAIFTNNTKKNSAYFKQIFEVGLYRWIFQKEKGDICNRLLYALTINR